jgi:hypothetical protein
MAPRGNGKGINLVCFCCHPHIGSLLHRSQLRAQCRASRAVSSPASILCRAAWTRHVSARLPVRAPRSFAIAGSRKDFHTRELARLVEDAAANKVGAELQTLTAVLAGRHTQAQVSNQLQVEGTGQLQPTYAARADARIVDCPACNGLLSCACVCLSAKTAVSVCNSAPRMEALSGPSNSKAARRPDGKTRADVPGPRSPAEDPCTGGHTSMSVERLGSVQQGPAALRQCRRTVNAADPQNSPPPPP